MAELVSVLPSTLKAKTFTFRWTIAAEFAQRDIYSCKSWNAFLNSGDVSDVNIPKWSTNFNLYLNERDIFSVSCTDTIYPDADGQLTHLKVSFINNKNEKMIIRDWEKVITSNETYKLSVLDSFLMCAKNGFATENKLTLVIEVDYVNKSTKNEVQSNAGVVQNPPTQLTSGFAQLFDTKQCSDVTLKAGDYTVKAHKAILIASSPVFAAMFQHDMEEQKSNTITISDISPEVLEEMLRFIYTDNIPKLDALAEDLLIAADKYALPYLKLECEKSLQANISIETAANTLLLADRYNAQKLKAKTLEFVTTNASKVIETPDWMEILKTGNNIQLVGEAFRALALK